MQGGNGGQPHTFTRAPLIQNVESDFPDVYIPKVGIIVDDQSDWNGSHSYSPVVLLRIKQFEKLFAFSALQQSRFTKCTICEQLKA